MAKATPLHSHQCLDEILKKLTSLVKKLPTTLLCGSKDGPLAEHLCDLNFTHHDSTEGPHYTFNKSWEHVFQCPDDQKELLVIRGKYGLEVALAYLAHFLKAPGVEENYSQAVNCKHTLLDTHSSLTAVSASKTVVVKEWLKKGFGEDVLITFVSSHNMIII